VPVEVPPTMAAAVYQGDGAMSVEWLPVPEPGPGEVLVEVSHCGICGTDLHLVLERYARAGSVLGHEWSGTVAGDNDAGLPVGTSVVADSRGGCGECRSCRRGRPSVCLRRPPPDYFGFRGAFAQYVTVDASRLLPLPSGLALRTAALAEPTAIAIHAVNLADVGPEDRVLVTGGGPVGLLITAVLAARGVRDVTVSEPSAGRRQRALEVGASEVIAPDALQPAPMGRPVASPFTIAFECSGAAPAAESALDQLDYAGTLVFVGTGREWPRINHNRAIVLELTVIGAYNYDSDGFGPALDLLASGNLPVDRLVETSDVTLAELRTTMDRLAAGELPGKVLVRPGGQS
jgi:(R,R)-butanediol dehydrogenase/meso-butanediol dehydrogenase/diacetyl reductase